MPPSLSAALLGRVARSTLPAAGSAALLAAILRGRRPASAEAAAVARAAAAAAPPPAAEAAPAPLSPLARLRRLVLLLVRGVYLSLVIGPLLLAAPLARLGPSWDDLWWRWCVRVAESSGALVIKLAQWASSRPDLFGEAACGRFAHLMDHTPPHPWAATARTLRRALGADWQRRLRLDQTVIGSGCIAQVYKGELRGNDGEWRPVAVKVIHPGVRTFVEADLDLLQFVASCVHALPTIKWLNPAGMAADFAKMLLSQLDLTVEAENLVRFRRNFPAEGSTNVYGTHEPALVTFPEPYLAYCSEELLVESFVDGVPILQWAATHPPEQYPEERRKICIAGIDAFVQMLFQVSSTAAITTTTSPPPPPTHTHLTHTATASRTTSSTATSTRATSSSRRRTSS